ncbi:MAG: bifunctional 5,10-methylenetetrahydrofolate dehydrogenase/5,10-methenyltetrahydrofolate cyclohydrolase [Clostridia bacterium]|nr:bifunctional 5,10-methylenetetrahydrofolate dehydrogenase/5,10-methenyltetrahydrofolate cyclohydrolase [Clostridia bacterium]
MANIIDGKKLALELRDECAERVLRLKERGVEPRLDVVIVGNDPASQQYVNSRLKDCADVGMLSMTHVLEAEADQSELTALLDALCADPAVHGILLQMPLPKHMDQDEVLSHIRPEKDVDGLTVLNAGALFTGREGFAPCTPSSIMHLIKSTGVPLKGKNAVVVGRSIVVGKPAAMLLLSEHATVTVCHSRTEDLRSHLERADIVVAAVGVPGLIKGDMLKPGAIVVDAGIKRVDGRTVGDVEFESAERVAGYISPVPGGVGPVTRKILLKNTLTAAERANGIG